jgi:hypothetical protein
MDPEGVLAEHPPPAREQGPPALAEGDAARVRRGVERGQALHVLGEVGRARVADERRVRFELEHHLRGRAGEGGRASEQMGERVKI